MICQFYVILICHFFHGSYYCIQVKENFRSDPRYKAVKHEERENAFNEYIAELKSAEREVEQAAKAKVDEQVCQLS